MILGGLKLSDELQRSTFMLPARCKFFQQYQRFVPSPPASQRTFLVLVGDDEYWKGYLARRAPLKRDYLAQLIRTLGDCAPPVIAIDFDLRSPAPDEYDNSDYAKETDAFVSAVKQVSKKSPIVLPVTLNRNASSLEPTVYSAKLGLVKDRIIQGHIQLPYDPRRIPLVHELAQGTIDSFAAAAVRLTTDKGILNGYASNELPFGRFIPPSKFRLAWARDVLNRSVPGLCDSIRGSVVVVGASWHQSSYKRGVEKIDAHLTPVGLIPGVFVHANYIEALLAGKTYRSIHESVQWWLDLIFALTLALTLDLRLAIPSWPSQLLWQGVFRILLKLSLVTLLLCTLLLLSYLFLQNLGIFVDILIPAVLLIAHSAVDYVIRIRLDLARSQTIYKEV